MFQKQEFKRHLLGIFEIAIFMRAGVERFKPDLNMVLRSFIWPAVMLPIAVILSSLMAPEHSFGMLLMLNFLRLAITFALSLLVIFFVAKKIDRTQYIYKYLTISNWFEIVLFFLVLPIIGVFGMGGGVEDIQNYVIFTTCLGLVYSGFILTHTLRIPWEMGVLLAVTFLFIQETGFDLVEIVKNSVYLT